jgi:uncharacterized protein
MTNTFLDNRKLRSLHRDVGYFFVGLFISFAISGIALNHRSKWNPERYQYDFKKVHTNFRLTDKTISIDSINRFSAANQLKNYRGFISRPDSVLFIAYDNADATINLVDGSGEVNIWRRRPIMPELVSLHTSFEKDDWYTLYSDVFCLGIIFIVATGMFLVRGKNSFTKRGWLLALIGIVIPIIALFVF